MYFVSFSEETKSGNNTFEDKQKLSEILFHSLHGGHILFSAHRNRPSCKTRLRGELNSGRGVASPGVRLPCELRLSEAVVGPRAPSVNQILRARRSAPRLEPTPERPRERLGGEASCAPGASTARGRPHPRHSSVWPPTPGKPGGDSLGTRLAGGCQLSLGPQGNPGVSGFRTQELRGGCDWDAVDHSTTYL